MQASRAYDDFKSATAYPAYRFPRNTGHLTPQPTIFSARCRKNYPLTYLSHRKTPPTRYKGCKGIFFVGGQEIQLIEGGQKMKNMTEKALRANRENSKYSTGPKTIEGKAFVRG